MPCDLISSSRNWTEKAFPVVRDLTFFVIAIQLHHLLLRSLALGRLIPHLVLLQIFKPERCLADATPGIMLNLPTLRRRKRLASPSIRLRRFGISSKIRTHKIIPPIDVEFSQQEFGSPSSVLHMDQPQVGICSSTRIPVKLLQAVQAVELLCHHLPFPVLRLICAGNQPCAVPAGSSTTLPALTKSITSTRPHFGSSCEYSLCHGRAGDCGRGFA